MHGAGTKAPVSGTEPPARLLDLTRLVSRVGHGPWTGVDRVERAYLSAVIADPVPAFGLVRGAAGFTLLGPEALPALADRLDGRVPWRGPDLIARLSRKLPAPRRAAEAECRRLGRGLALPRGLGALLRKHLPPGTVWLNTGHSNLDAGTFAAIAGAGGRAAVMVHDTIPLDFPDLQRPGTPERFETRMRAVSAHADLVLCNSAATQADMQRHFTRFGRVPESLVAPLGVEVAPPDPTALPPGLGLNSPYFVTLGTIEPRKNHELLLDIWDDFAADPPPGGIPPLYIVGTRGWANEAVFARLDRLPPGGPVRELGGLPGGAVSALLAGAAGLLSPSIAEGYGLPPLEAQALGTPVLVPPLPVYRETLAASAVYADPSDRYAWAQEIRAMAARKEQGAGEDPAGPPRDTPSWDSHFNLVFSRI